MVSGLEDEVLPRSVDESFPEVLDGVLELLRHENLVRKSSEGEIEVVGELSVLKSLGLMSTKERKEVSKTRGIDEEEMLSTRTLAREYQIFSMS